MVDMESTVRAKQFRAKVCCALPYFSVFSPIKNFLKIPLALSQPAHTVGCKIKHKLYPRETRHLRSRVITGLI